MKSERGQLVRERPLVRADRLSALRYSGFALLPGSDSVLGAGFNDARRLKLPAIIERLLEMNRSASRRIPRVFPALPESLMVELSAVRNVKLLRSTAGRTSLSGTLRSELELRKSFIPSISVSLSFSRK